MGPLRHVGRRQLHFEATDSTNSRAAELAHDPSYAGTVVTADLQTRGRGQHGRVWESPPGVNVLLSALLFPPPALRRPVILTAFAAVIVGETVLQATGMQTRIKWPNDVLVGGKKVCGILIEGGVIAADRDPHFVVGIGLNVNQGADDFVRLGLVDATSMAIAVGGLLDVPEITQLLVGNLDAEYDRLLNSELADLEARWKWRLGLDEKSVSVELMDANEVRGRLIELGFGGLAVETPGGDVRRLMPEEIRHIREVGVVGQSPR